MPKINWEKWGAMIATTAVLIGAGVAIAPVLSYADRITVLEKDKEAVSKRLIRLEDKIDFLMIHLGIHYTQRLPDDL